MGLLAALPAIGGILQGAGTIASAFGASQQLSQRDAMQAQGMFNWDTYKKSLLQGPGLEIRGLKAAGVNPLLRYGSHGSPTPVSAMGVSQAPSVNRLAMLGDAGEAVSSAVDLAKGQAETRQLEALTVKAGEELTEIAARVKLLGAQTDKTSEEAQNVFVDRYTKYLEQALLRVQTDQARASIEQTLANIRNLDALTAVNTWNAVLSELQVPRAQQDAKFWASVQGEYAARIDAVGRSLNPFASSIQPK